LSGKKKRKEADCLQICNCQFVRRVRKRMDTTISGRLTWDGGENVLVIKREASVMIVRKSRKKANGLQRYYCQFARRHYSIRYSKVKSM
jgi:hypothetical protein